MMEKPVEEGVGQEGMKIPVYSLESCNCKLNKRNNRSHYRSDKV